MKALLPMKSRTNTSLGFSERAERIFAFLIPILSGLILLALERNTMVRSRARFSVKVLLPIFLVWLLLFFLGGLLHPIPLIGLLGGLILFFSGVVGWIFWIVWLVMLLGALFLEWRGRSGGAYR
jgi:uncharacterized membrane protein